uniref:CPG4 domain-containing protein n=1 Tax=Heterorhabditis bacteriophora TaxID=37862 RepID=A0A1I7X485_HETBA
MSIIFYMVFVFSVFVCDCTRFRRHRQRSMESEEEGELVTNHHPRTTPPCNTLCEAQWKHDFHVTFHRHYETEFFDVPLDNIILANLSTLSSFCSLTEQKYACLERECLITKHDWTPEKHICIDELEKFRENIHCLSKTRQSVHTHCQSVCLKLESLSVLSQIEINYLIRMKMQQTAKDEYIEQNKACHFIACHQMCHKRIISRLCSHGEIQDAREMIRDYYDSYLRKDLAELENSQHGELFSSFCRRVTLEENENAFISNMTNHNNQVLESIRREIKFMTLRDLLQ